VLSDQAQLRVGHHLKEVFVVTSRFYRKRFDAFCKFIEAWRLVFFDACFAKGLHAFHSLVKEVALETVCNETFNELLHLLDGVAYAVSLPIVYHLREVSNRIDA